ncbi:hypothetical protein CBL_21400 [Carabus blaptoides fortunei]
MFSHKIPRIKNAELVPVPFRARYANVQSIIDCLEIQVQKPNDPIKQALTWSEYKNCNTLKHLVSCTPNGIVNFIYTGFGGRTSDKVIVENCGYLEKLPSATHIMADRGFKHVAQLFAQKNCTLVRPPSVPSSTKSSKQDVILTKQIASLRIHVERVVRRIREFKMLRPHSCLHNKLLASIDNIIIVACGLINMQGALIK